MGTLCGIGVDIVEMRRITGIRHVERFSEFFLSPHEQAQLANSVDKAGFIASRFAAKEAVIKAFPHTITAVDFEIRKNGVKPFVHFFNPAHRAYRVHVSLSHSTDYAAGYAQVETI
jgi:holo-[acyl-carrier protein] synthase